jgi:hypothetical protein
MQSREPVATTTPRAARRALLAFQGGGTGACTLHGSMRCRPGPDRRLHLHNHPPAGCCRTNPLAPAACTADNLWRQDIPDGFLLVQLHHLPGVRCRNVQNWHQTGGLRACTTMCGPLGHTCNETSCFTVSTAHLSVLSWGLVQDRLMVMLHLHFHVWRRDLPVGNLHHQLRPPARHALLAQPEWRQTGACTACGQRCGARTYLTVPAQPQLHPPAGMRWRLVQE